LLHASGIRTLAIDRDEASLQQAILAGAETALAIETAEASRFVQTWAGGERGGVDCVFELVGKAATMKAAAGFVRRAGQIVVIGEEPEFPALDTIEIAQKELRLIGSRNGGLQDAQDAIAFMDQGIIRPMIAARFPLDQINLALAAVRKGAIRGRAVITMKD